VASELRAFPGVSFDEIVKSRKSGENRIPGQARNDDTATNAVLPITTQSVSPE
jgi:hypothetical protein